MQYSLVSLGYLLSATFEYTTRYKMRSRPRGLRFMFLRFFSSSFCHFRVSIVIYQEEGIGNCIPRATPRLDTEMNESEFAKRRAISALRESNDRLCEVGSNSTPGFVRGGLCF